MQYKKAHFIGIAGKGMSATALLLRQMGVEISGSDAGFYPPVSTYLQNAGILFSEGYKAENIPPDADIIIIGKNAKLVPEENEEVAAAFAWQAGLPAIRRVKSFPDILEELTRSKETLVVAGSYGKSTSTALLAWCLKEAGKDPSYFIGEVTKGFEQYAHLGQGNVFVLEGDEYPSANWDPTSKFLHYNAKNVLLTSATHDHVNVYPTHEDYLKPFRQLLASLPKDGLLVASTERFAGQLASECAAPTISYGLTTGQWHAANIVHDTTTTFDLMHEDEKVATFSTTLLGDHNIENIVGISALLLTKKLLTPQELAEGVASFQGVKRRLELLSHSRVPVYEGFGSSYEKARSAMEAVAKHYPGRRLVVIFEPHTFSWRNRDALAWYDSVFREAAKVYIYEPASQGAATHAQVTQEEIVERVRAAGLDTTAIHDETSALELLRNDLKAEDVILLLTSGDLGGLIVSTPTLVEELFPLAE
ncbi:MAG: UDP-N-acetylmuramate: L-alanyl-gamma-D-glutamyl-meso-diaminopimelate ligase [Patescibacteria group bacterium]|nr:UDP-N-acetylmuramate: L-alanyl-gamma-D-glutamyl-meso-diaminopimelate ligase [Patescibacteria group bacterium]